MNVDYKQVSSYNTQINGFSYLFLDGPLSVAPATPAPPSVGPPSVPSMPTPPPSVAPSQQQNQAQTNQNPFLNLPPLPSAAKQPAPNKGMQALTSKPQQQQQQQQQLQQQQQQQPPQSQQQTQVQQPQATVGNQGGKLQNNSNPLPQVC